MCVWPVFRLNNRWTLNCTRPWKAEINSVELSLHGRWASGILLLFVWLWANWFLGRFSQSLHLCGASFWLNSRRTLSWTSPGKAEINSGDHCLHVRGARGILLSLVLVLCKGPLGPKKITFGHRFRWQIYKNCREPLQLASNWSCRWQWDERCIAQPSVLESSAGRGLWSQNCPIFERTKCPASLKSFSRLWKGRQFGTRWAWLHLSR